MPRLPRESIASVYLNSEVFQKLYHAEFSEYGSFVKLPMSVQTLESFLPHRGPAVWIDTVSSVDEKGGCCEVFFNPQATYSTGSTFISAAFIEWMAQSFGYVSAAQRRLGVLPTQGNLQQAFLAAIKNFEIISLPTELAKNQKILVHVSASHVVGPITLVDGRVEIDGTTLARAQLKLFAVPQAT